MAGRDRVGIVYALVRPVRYAYRGYLAFFDVTVEPLQNGFDSRSGVIVVQKIQVDEIGVERPERRVKIV